MAAGPHLAPQAIGGPGPGSYLLVKYDLPDTTWHSRLLLAHLNAGEWIVLTPDGDIYSEEYSPSNGDIASWRPYDPQVGAPFGVAVGDIYELRLFDPHFVRTGLTKLAFCHMFGRATCAISSHVPTRNSYFTTCLRPPRTISGGGWRQRRFAFYHMFAHSTRAISAEGCSRTNKTRISPHVWVTDTPRRVTFRKPPPGCPCRQREIEELEK